MKLSKLIKDLVPEKKERPLEMDPDIRSIHYRSQTVSPGGVFVAIQGLAADGHDYIADAVKRGASAVVVEKPAEIDNAVVVRVKNSRKALAAISSRFYDDPSTGLCLIGITGTNGKTTTTYIIENILKKAGLAVGVIGTINYRYGGSIFDNPMTTPESLDLQKILNEMKGYGVTHVVMEVSSHAIDLERVAHCYFDIGVFTNLSQDHLDYHKDMETYWACKKHFFTHTLDTGPKREKAVAVINCDDEKGADLFKICQQGKISVGFGSGTNVRLKEDQQGLNGTSGKIVTEMGDIPFHSPLVGKYNVENILCAAGVGVALNLPLDVIESGIRDTGLVPGRLEFIENDAGKFVYIDYAHTPDALGNVLQAIFDMKPSTSRIICVFGCGGDRDKSKRPLMGEIAGRMSDLVIITTDNPRTEAPVDIIRQIEKGVKKTSLHFYSNLYLQQELKIDSLQKGYAVETDRKKAIALGINAAGPGDIVLIAGKGHETYQIIGTQKTHFDDREVARHALRHSARGRRV